MEDLLLVTTPCDRVDPRLAIAAVHAGAVGLCDLGPLVALTPAARGDMWRTMVDHLGDALGRQRRWGCRIDLWDGRFEVPALSQRGRDRLPLLLFAGLPTADGDRTTALVERARRRADTVLGEAYGVDDAVALVEAGVDGIVVKANEAGGRCSDRSAFVLAQALDGTLDVPYWIQGAWGPDSAAAAVLSGATGVVLGEELWLTDAAAVEDEDRRRLTVGDGTESRLVTDGRATVRLAVGADRPAVEAFAAEVVDGSPLLDALATRWTAETGAGGANAAVAPTLYPRPLGQGVAHAARVAARHPRLHDALTAYRRTISRNARRAPRLHPLRRGAPLAQSHGTTLPLVQGPMTRVSDEAAFAASVADHGALPLLALALLRGPQVETLLRATRDRLEGRRWGVGILGFVPPELREEQLTQIRAVRPDVVLIAGGRPSQAASLEDEGIATYLHVPSPVLLETFLAQGARRFVLEGSECGGHVGPRSSMLLWQSAVDVIADADLDDPSEVHILLAGGIHDAHSAAAAQTVAVPLVERGVRVGALMGTAYLFTEEAVESGAIVAEYQRQALATTATTLLESSPGQATRTAVTPFAHEFLARRRALQSAGRDPDAVRAELEMLNVGRLRLASKGAVREPGRPRASDDASDGPVDDPEGAPGEGGTPPASEDGEPTPDAERQRLAELGGVGTGPLTPVDVDRQRRDGLYMLGEVATLRGRVQTMADLHADVTDGSGDVLRARAPAVLERVRARPEQRDPAIAIVGMAALFPDSPDLQSYWRNLVEGFDAVRQVPSHRWDPARYHDPDPRAVDGIATTAGSFLPPVRFDPLRYRIPPSSVHVIEPIQLLALEVARRALDDADWERPTFPRDRTAVVFGAGGVHRQGLGYSFRAMLPHYVEASDALDQRQRAALMAELRSRLPTWTEDSFPGFLPNVVSGRVANMLDLQGPNFTVDAACASSLGALEAAVSQLRAGACDAAVVGGVDASNNPFVFTSFARTHALTPSGVPKPFDAAADGIVLGEGVAAVVCKRLSDAVVDGDDVWAVIRGIGSSSDGRARSLVAPRIEGQVLALERAYVDAGVLPDEVTLVEAHATGTTEGDRVELAALRHVLGDDGPRGRCAVGSAKSNIGHTKTAAGMAGLVKAALALRHRVLPPTINVTTPHPLADGDGPVYVNTTARPWIVGDGDRPRVAGVSAFGFGGTNFHAVLEEPTGSLPLDLGARPAEIFVWAGRERGEVAARLRATMPDEGLDVDVAQLGRSLATEADGPPAATLVRVACVAGSVEELRDGVAEALRVLDEPTPGHRQRGVHVHTGEAVDPAGVCLLFPGQGSQRVGMLGDLVRAPFDTSVFDRADALLSDRLPARLSSYLFPPPAFDDARVAAQRAALNDTRIAQPGLGVVDLFALDVLGRFGLHPTTVAGHSYGEYVALCAAGVYGRDDLLRISADRGEAVHRVGVDSPGGMVAVSASPDAVAAAIAELGVDAVVANRNAPKSTVVAGPQTAIDRLVEELPARGLAARRVPVTAAFHSPWVADASAALGQQLIDVEMGPPRIPVYSNATAAPYPDDPDGIRSLLTAHLAEPVRFVDEIRALWDAGARVFVEAGPGRVLTGLVGRILGDRSHHRMALDGGARGSSWRSLANLLAQAWALGLPIDLDPWYAGRGLHAADVATTLAHAAKVSSGRTTDVLLDGGGVRRVGETASVDDGATPADTTSSRAHAPTHASPEARSEPSTQPHRPRAHTDEPRGDGAMRNPTLHTEAAAAGPEPVAPPATKRPPSTPDVDAGELAARSTLDRWLSLQEAQQRLHERFLGLYERVLFERPRAEDVRTRPAGDTHVVRDAPIPGQSGPLEQAHVFATPVPLPEAPAPLLPPLDLADHPTRAVPGGEPNGAAPADPAGPADMAPTVPSEVDDRAEPEGGADVPGDPGAPPPVETFQRELIAQVSERTGYPEDMLALDEPLEAGLGVDSIKMMEIFSALRAYHAVLGEDGDEEAMMIALSELKTLREIVDRYATRRAAIVDGEVVDAPFEARP